MLFVRRRLANSVPTSRKFASLAIIGTAATLMLTACGSSGADVSAEGQINYACALIEDVTDQRASVADWELRIGDETDPAMISAIGAAALTGGMTAGGADVSEAMQGAGRDIFSGISRLDAEILQEGVDVFAKECAAR